MNFDYTQFLFLVAYLLGAIPFSVVIGKVFFGIDVRKQGSGNPGATNTLRILGLKAGIAVLLLDAGKGVGAVFLGKLITPIDPLSIEETQMICGALAILGHISSPFLGFKGGKGVATATGVIFCLHPLSGLILTAIFAIILAATRYVSLGSITAAFIYPLTLSLLYPATSLKMYIFSISLALLISYKHRANIGRLLKGTENKFGAKTAP